MTPPLKGRLEPSWMRIPLGVSRRMGLVHGVLSAYYQTTPEVPGWERFRGLHQGERCFIMGGGPSLLKCDLSRLKNEITFGVNGIFLLFDQLQFQPTYYAVEDTLVFQDRWLEIKKHLTSSECFFPLQFKSPEFSLPNYTFFRSLTEMDPYWDWPAFSRNPAKYIWCGGTVTYVCIQLAWYMGFSEVYLVGIDHNYARPSHVQSEGVVWTSNGSDPNHFHPDYFGTGKRWHDPRVDRMEKAYRKAKKVFAASGRKLINATVGGHLETFPRVDFASLFQE